MKYSRSRDATLTLRNLASAERCAPKRTDGDAGLPPPNERSGTQPTSPEKLRQRHAARRLFRESLSQPHVVLGTPIPPTQQSTRRFRALAPSPPLQPTAHPIASHSDPSPVRSSTTGLGYSYLAARFHKGGKDSQDEPSKAVARAKQAAIQRDHRSRRRVGETVSLTPTISQLGVFGDFEGPGEDASQDRLQPSELLGGDEIRKEGDDRGQFSESDIDVEDYFNLLLSPARPRRYLKQLGVESDPDLGDEHENSDNDCVDGSPLRHRLRQPSARPRRGRRGPAPGTGGRPRKSPRQARSSMPPRRIRSPVIIPPEELAVFHAQDPVWNGDLDACALTDRDKATLREFWTTLDNDQMEYCTRCQECWFQMKIDSDGICERCYRKDRKRRPDEPYFFSADNQLDFGPVPARLPQLTPTEESLLARVHVHVNIMLVRGQQYKYRGHVVHFLREVGLVYNQLPLLPQELNTVLLRPANTSSHANLSRQFTRQFRVRRQPVVIWLDYLRRHHPGYRCVVIDEERLNQLPQDGNVLDAIPQSQVEAADVGPDSPEEDQEAEPDLEDEAAVPDLLAKDTELDALRSILSGESGADSELSTSFQAQAQHELQLPNIRHTPINEFNRSHALLSLAFPCLFPDGRADFVEPRLRSIDYRDYVEHAMRWHDGRFARHPTFRFVAFNTLMRSQARSRSRFFVKQHDGRQQPLTREQLIQALEHSEDPEAQALINSITRHAVSIRGTRPFWNKRRQDLEAYAYNLGCPGAFITFSPADLHWRSLYQHMPQYDDWLAATEPERMALSRRLLRQNPHIAAFHFYRRYCLFRDIVLSKKFNITDYWDRYEWQGRGSPHNHGLYWMDSCPGTDMEDEAARDVFARTWGFHVTAINPEQTCTRASPDDLPFESSSFDAIFRTTHPEKAKLGPSGKRKTSGRVIHSGERQATLMAEAIEEYGIAKQIGYHTGDNATSNDTCLKHLSQMLQDKYGISFHPNQRRIRCIAHIINLSLQAFLLASSKEALRAALAAASDVTGAEMYEQFYFTLYDVSANEPTSRSEASEQQEQSFSKVWKGKAKRAARKPPDFRDDKFRGWQTIPAMRKLHNIAVWLRNSSIHSDLWEDRVSLRLGIDNDTRWNSWYKLIDNLIRRQSQIKQFLLDYDKEINDNILNSSDWDYLERTYRFLHPFASATLWAEGKNSTLSQILTIMDGLLRHYEKNKEHYSKPETFDRRILHSIEMGWFILDKYYTMTEDAPVYAAALLLDPSKRIRYIERHWPESWHENAIAGVRTIWEEYKTQPETGPAESVDEVSASQKRQPNEWDALLEELEVTEDLGDSMDDLEDFIKATPIKISGSPLQWWCHKDQRKTYPQLSRMAIDILSIAPESADPESAFSGGRRTLSWDRERMTCENLEKVECIGNWLREGHIQKTVHGGMGVITDTGFDSGGGEDSDGDILAHFLRVCEYEYEYHFSA
ncbi:hypothetical protein FOFC_03000 [Fusarium oxysporum]|nr:hypothetical protein FOFC_03000 [Fusarium oxysporum]